MSRKLAVVAAILGILVLAACTPEQIAVFQKLDPASQKAVLDHLASQNQPRDCYEAIDRYWPGDKGWAKKIVWRESNNTPTARNPSGASGCFQMMLPLHANRFQRVGYSPSEWANPKANTLAAWTLYQEAGTSPWVATNY